MGRAVQKHLTPKKRVDRVSRCALCRGTKMLCGKARCPVLVRFSAAQKTRSAVSSLHLGGASPPGVFVGRFGYPKVALGPMIPPVSGDTSLIDAPERWLSHSLDDIVDFRSQLVRGKSVVGVNDVEGGGKLVEFTRELALAKNPVFAEAVFEKKPRGLTQFFSDAQPMGPSAPMKSLDISNPKYEPHLEKVLYDTDLGSRQGLLDVYKSGVPLSQMQRAFSMGVFGQKKNRRFVPTRWSITAIDSTLGLQLLEKTKTMRLLDDFLVFQLVQFDNRWLVVLLPSEWRYELIEAWYPKTAWNQFGSSISVFNSYEFFEGRKQYADIGGCYYAARLAVNEYLHKISRQAGCVILREAHPGYIMPIGVWNVRECVRQALRTQPLRCESLSEVFEQVSEVMDIPMSRWLRNSAVLSERMHQRRLEDFV